MEIGLKRGLITSNNGDRDSGKDSSMGTDNSMDMDKNRDTDMRNSMGGVAGGIRYRPLYLERN